MTPTEIRTAVRSLQAQGHSLREISRLLALSRNTVRRILRQPAGSGAETPPCDEVMLGKLKAAFTRARGNGVRVRELLADDGLEVSYSTLTRWVREADLRGPLRRAGTYDFVPGQEMQHDTSPHRVRFVPADKPVTVQCAGLVLAYSRRLFIQVLSALHPLRGQGVPARGGPLHGRRLPGLRHRQHQRLARRRRRCRGRYRAGDGGLRPHSSTALAVFS